MRFGFLQGKQVPKRAYHFILFFLGMASNVLGHTFIEKCRLSELAEPRKTIVITAFPPERPEILGVASGEQVESLQQMFKEWGTDLAINPGDYFSKEKRFMEDEGLRDPYGKIEDPRFLPLRATFASDYAEQRMRMVDAALRRMTEAEHPDAITDLGNFVLNYVNEPPLHSNGGRALPGVNTDSSPVSIEKWVELFDGRKVPANYSTAAINTLANYAQLVDQAVLARSPSRYRADQRDNTDPETLLYTLDRAIVSHAISNVIKQLKALDGSETLLGTPIRPNAYFQEIGGN